MWTQSITSHFNSIPRWMRRHGTGCDVILSSRVRLARNFSDQSFPHTSSSNELLRLRESTFALLLEVSQTSNVLDNAGILPFEEFADWERQSLVERHLTSKDHISQELGRALVALPDSSLSLLINEEDHLRLQGLLPGLQLEAAYALTLKLDDLVEKQCEGEFAFDLEMGYLTACPTNTGTGLRASVMLHLPALELAGHLPKTKEVAAGHGFVLRGTFGEGSHSHGHLHQISNQITLGKTEETLLKDVEETALRIAAKERELRIELAQTQSPLAMDAIGRAYGTLRFARQISYHEAAGHLSMLRLGTHLGWVKGLSHLRFNQLMIDIRPACLQVAQGHTMTTAKRDQLRADMLRQLLLKIRLDAILTTEKSPHATRS